MQYHNNCNPVDLIAQKELKYACDIYEREIYPDGQSIMCAIHDSFHKENDKAHNCIGCNFADYTQLLYTSLQNYSQVANPFEAFTGTIMYAYLLVERFEEIFKIIELHNSYRQKHFQVFGIIKRWANFLKHPKAFILVHHPDYHFQSYITIEPTDKDILTIIDQSFIDTYYAGDSNNSKLYNILSNKKSVVVLFPKLSTIISDFCVAQKKFIDIISNNEVFREILDGKTTLKDYFEGTTQPTKSTL